MKDIDYPIRINRYLYLKDLCSRRQADRFIEDGLVFVNGKKAVLGQKVHENDSVELKGKAQKAPSSYVYFVFNKPKGIVTHNPQGGEQGVEDIFPPASFSRPQEKRVFPVGRLDKDSTGLLLLTNDGRIVNKLLNPEYDHEKEYIVRVNKELKPSFENKMERGVDIEGYTTKPARVRVTSEDTFRIILTEGKKHQIRRMVTALGYEVRALKRVRIMNIKLGGLRQGQSRKLTPPEVTALLKKIGITT